MSLLPHFVVDGLYLQSGSFHTGGHILGVVHLTVSVGDVGKIDTRHGESHGGRLVLLAVPQGLHDAHAAVLIHHLRHALQD